MVADMISGMPGQGSKTSRGLIALAAVLVALIVIAPFFML
jgi:hypothetical protein